MSDPGAATKSVATVKITIDGREITAEAGQPLLQVALDNGIEIPHYCYHPKLSIDGSCRMCQVKIEKAPKLAIACNTPVADGMVVDTRHEEVADARRGVMELLLVNHPLDCPICDQAGECYLQDYSFGYGSQHARTSSARRKGVKRYPIGSRVVFDQERCILCRRCVRFTKEISETDELRVFGIGDHSRIDTAPGAPLENDYSICTADICPVGALLSRDFHHKRRVWFLQEFESVCPSCSNGCNVKLGMFQNHIQRLVPRRNDAVNDTWMCDHGRLRYAFAQDETRVREARATAAASGNGARPVASTDEAIAEAASRIRAAAQAHGAASVAILGSPHLTNEECFRLVGLRDAIGTPHLDLVVPLGDADDFLIKAEKAANARGARDVGVAPAAGGKDAAGILAACAAGEIKVLYVVGSADLLAVLGEAAVQAAADGVETLIVQDANVSALTDRAHVVLPGLVWAEKDGSFTNHAGHVQRIRRAMKAHGDAASDGEIFVRLAGWVREGKAPASGFDPRATFLEIAAAVPAYAGMTLERLGSRGLPAGAAAAPATEAAAAPGGA
jgi:NADH-quinone oxidoreductase subunit G